MSILYNEDQLAIERETNKFLEARYDKDLLLQLLERQAGYDEGLWKDCCDQGWPGVAIPEEFGGLGLSLVETGVIAEAGGRHCIGFPFFAQGVVASFGIEQFGDEALRQLLLPQVAGGDIIGCLAFAEPHWVIPSTPDVKIIGNLLRGTKPSVSGGAHADYALVLAEKDDSPALICADLRQPNVDRVVLQTFDNSRCAADLVFDGVPFDILLVGDEALDAVQALLARLSVIVAHEQVGGAQASLTIARDYALERRAFGQVIGGFQSVKHRIAEMYGLVELAKANALHAASLEDTDEFVKAAAAARLSATQAYETSIRDAIQIHGGIGVTWEAALHLHQRRARTLAIEAGSTPFWEDCLVDQILEANA